MFPEMIVEEAFALNVWSPVNVFGLAKFNPTVCAVPPLYEPENVSVPFVAVRLARFAPRAIPEMVELVNPALSNVPEIVGVKVADTSAHVP